MQHEFPLKVLITGGNQAGGVDSVAKGLAEGFIALGIPAEIVSPARILRHWQDLRNPRVLKILSTTAVFASLFARRAICVAHGVPCAAFQGWAKLILIAASFKLSNICAGTQLASVSEYTAIHLRAIFKIRTDAVILNPVKPLYLEKYEAVTERDCVTYVGRLTPAKNLHRLLPVVRNLLNEHPELRMCIIGDGPDRSVLEESVSGDSRFEFKGSINDLRVRDCLRRTKIFVSCNLVEGLGVTYLEALSQGCTVVMPASGGGVEIALDQVGQRVHLLPISLDGREMLEVLRRALTSESAPMAIDGFSARAAAQAYLGADAGFNASGMFHAEVAE